MKEIRPLHHVYSSDGGYRTLYASQDLAEGTIRVLEAFASASQRSYSHGQAFSCLTLVEGPVVLACTFVHGADHVGRRRLCSHAMILPESVLDELEFHPAAPPIDRFMTKEVPAERPGHYLAPTITLPGPKEVDAAQQRAFQELDEENVDLMTALLSPARTAVVASSAGEGLARLASVGWLLPPEVRAGLTYRMGTWPPEDVHMFGNVSVVLLQKSTQLENYPPGEFVHLDLYDEEQDDDELTPAEGFGHPYVDFLLDLKHAERGEERVRAFLQLLEQHRGPAEPSFDQQSCLVSGYRLAEPALDEYASTGKVVQHVPDLISSISFLARSGRIPLAESLVAELRRNTQEVDPDTLKRSITGLQKLLQKGFFLQGLSLGQDLVEYGKELRRAVTTTQAPS